jgi:OOP family OmpA-OmpF porin
MRIKKLIIVIGLLPLLFCVSANSMAENTANSLTLSPLFGGYLFGNDQDIKSKPSYGLGIGYNLSKKLSIEGAFSYIDTESKEDNSDIDALLYNINALYHFTPYKKLLPYISAGIGAITLNYQDDGDDTDFTINYGAGLKYFFSESIALRGDM